MNILIYGLGIFYILKVLIGNNRKVYVGYSKLEKVRRGKFNERW